MFRKAAPTIAMVGVLVGAAVAALGLPDFGKAGRLLTGSDTSNEAVLAAVSILAWLIIGIAAVIAVVQALRTVHAEAQLMPQRWARALLFLVTGLTVLVIGTVHHLAASASLCCGNTTEAGQLVR